MLTYEECLEFCDLTQDEINAIAEHEHCEGIQAMAKGNYLVHTDGGELKIRAMILDDIRHAQETGNRQHEMELKRVLACFIKNHPQNTAVER